MGFPAEGGGGDRGTDSLRDVVDYYGAVGIAVVHWCQGLVAFLASGVPEAG